MSEDAMITAERLEHLYVVEGRSLASIGAVLGRSPSGVRKLLTRHGIASQGIRPPRLRDDEIDIGRARQLYQSGLSLKAVATELGTTPDKVSTRLKRAGVELRTPGAPSGRLPALDSDDLRRAYLARLLDIDEIAREFACSPAHIRNELRRHAIRRGRRPARRPDWLELTPELLHQLYIVEQLTMKQIAERAGGSSGRVLDALRRAGISARPVGTIPTRQLAPLTVEQLRQLYVVEGLSAYAIARQLGGSAQRVYNALDAAGISRRTTGRPVKPLTIPRADLEDLVVGQRWSNEEIADAYGTTVNQVRLRLRAEGIRRPSPPVPPPPRPSLEEIASLYVDHGVTLNDLANRYHVGRERMRAWLAEAGVSVAPRTSRASRRRLPADTIVRAYWEDGLSAADIAAQLGTAMHQVLRTLHDAGAPVRLGGANTEAMCVLEQLYADPDLLQVLRRHGIPIVREPGPIATRFPQPVPLGVELLETLYIELGLSARHIELVTGQPADQVLDRLHDEKLEVRPLGSPSPWRQRHLRFAR